MLHNAKLPTYFVVTTGPLERNGNGPGDMNSCLEFIANPPADIDPLVCGAMHTKLMGGTTGYYTLDRWCATARAKSGTAPISLTGMFAYANECPPFNWMSPVPAMRQVWR